MTPLLSIQFILFPCPIEFILLPPGLGNFIQSRPKAENKPKAVVLLHSGVFPNSDGSRVFTVFRIVKNPRTIATEIDPEILLLDIVGSMLNEGYEIKMKLTSAKSAVF